MILIKKGKIYENIGITKIKILYDKSILSYELSK